MRPIDAAWARLTGPEVFPVNRGAVEGRPYALQAGTGDRFSGTVLLHVPRRGFLATVRELDDAALRLMTHRAGGQTGVDVWLAAYDPRVDIAGFQRRAESLLQRVFKDL